MVTQDSFNYSFFRKVNNFYGLISNSTISHVDQKIFHEINYQVVWNIKKFLSLLEQYFNEQIRLLTNKFHCFPRSSRKIVALATPLLLLENCQQFNESRMSHFFWFWYVQLPRSRFASHKGHFLLKPRLSFFIRNEMMIVMWKMATHCMSFTQPPVTVIRNIKKESKISLCAEGTFSSHANATLVIWYCANLCNEISKNMIHCSPTTSWSSSYKTDRLCLWRCQRC